MTSHNSSKITAIYLKAIGPQPKFAIRRSVSPFHERYDIHYLWGKIDIIKDLVEILDRECAEFLEQFAAIDKKYHREKSHRTRHYISNKVEDLYPNKDISFCKQHSFSYKNYWIGTNISAKQICEYVQEMCDACNINYYQWRDIKL